MANHDNSDEIGRPSQGADLFTIWLDVPITRRKRFNLITDPEGRTVFRDRLMGPCIEWLQDHDVEKLRICSEQYTYGVRLLWGALKGKD